MPGWCRGCGWPRRSDGGRRAAAVADEGAGLAGGRGRAQGAAVGRHGALGPNSLASGALGTVPWWGEGGRLMYTCYHCGRTIPPGQTVRRRVEVMESSGWTSAGSAAWPAGGPVNVGHYADVPFCRRCAARHDRRAALVERRFPGRWPSRSSPRRHSSACSCWAAPASSPGAWSWPSAVRRVPPARSARPAEAPPGRRAPDLRPLAWSLPQARLSLT